MYTLTDAIKYHRPAIFLSRLLSRKWMHRLRTLFALLALGSGLSTLFVVIIDSYAFLYQYTLGFFLISIALWLEQILIYSFHNHFYFFGIRSILGRVSEVRGVSYEVADALASYEHDVALGFATSTLGHTTLRRAGLTDTDITSYLSTQTETGRTLLTTASIPLESAQITSLLSVATYLLHHDDALTRTLAQAGIQKEHFLKAVSWVVLSHHTQKQTEEWWGKDMLSRSPGIGRGFSYGYTYHLEKFTKDLYTSAVFSHATSNYDSVTTYVDQLEEALARNQASNALIIGKPGVGKIDIVIALQERIKEGTAVASVVDQKFVVLNTELIFANSPTKVDFEQIFLTILNESLTAGNIVLVIEHISTVIRQAEALDVFIPELMEPYLAHPSFHIIALDTPEHFHNVLERATGFVRYFDEIMIEEAGVSGTVLLLQSITPSYEAQGMFTYPALEAIATGAERYLVDGVMPDKAIALLGDVSLRVPETGNYTPDFVYSVIASKTGMPVGPISEKERSVLLHLEDTLHTRVIGQDAALAAIAKTMRRARAGIVNSERPLGSFLFLGPTGVGKTETAKALAYVFFGDEQNMVRLDMSEYSTEDRIGHLIGNFEEGGVLPSLLQEHPYTVLLLDEFEKSHPKIHDLFLQILDEGMFTSGQGNRINVRNTLIIATSNAGSDYIIASMQSAEPKSNEEITKTLISTIISEGLYRPELINRFDNTIVFTPLSKSEQYEVAKLLLRDLSTRIAEQGYVLTITPALISHLAEKGYDPLFGARPMQRVIQDTIEEAVAQKIIAGSVQKGAEILLDIADIQS